MMYKVFIRINLALLGIYAYQSRRKAELKVQRESRIFSFNFDKELCWSVSLLYLLAIILVVIFDGTAKISCASLIV